MLKDQIEEKKKDKKTTQVNYNQPPNSQLGS
jgi:hypothetical protein